MAEGNCFDRLNFSQDFKVHSLLPLTNSKNIINIIPLVRGSFLLKTWNWTPCFAGVTNVGKAWFFVVILAEAGSGLGQAPGSGTFLNNWIPASAGMTNSTEF